MSELNYYILKPSFRFAEERVVERSNDRVSQNIRAALARIHWRRLTPTTLRWSTLSSANRKEGEEIALR